MTGQKPKRERNKIDNQSSDRDYFIITPRLVWAFARHPYDYTLWSVVKDIAGEHGQCILDTNQLATLAMMSGGQVSDSREYLIAIGLFVGDKFRETNYPLPVWHLTIPDLWRPNVEWSQQFKTIAARLDFKTQQKPAVKKVWDKYLKTKTARKAKGEWKYDQEVFHTVKIALGFSYSEKPFSPGEKPPTYGEKPPTPGERKKIMIDHDHLNELMNDPISQFLRGLPGYNPQTLETDRAAIVEQGYSLEALEYLWAFAQVKHEPERGTPIGLLLAMVANGQQAPDYMELLADRRRREEMVSAAAQAEARRDERQGISHPDFEKALDLLKDTQPALLAAAAPILLEVDARPNRMLIKLASVPPGFLDELQAALRQVTRRSYRLTFQTPATGQEHEPDAPPEPPATDVDDDEQLFLEAMLNEIRQDVTPATWRTMLAPARLLSANGQWTIAVPSTQWWETHMRINLTRIYQRERRQKMTFAFVPAGGA